MNYFFSKLFYIAYCDDLTLLYSSSFPLSITAALVVPSRLLVETLECYTKFTPLLSTLFFKLFYLFFIIT